MALKVSGYSSIPVINFQCIDFSEQETLFLDLFLEKKTSFVRRCGFGLHETPTPCCMRCLHQWGNCMCLLCPFACSIQNYRLILIVFDQEFRHQALSGEFDSFIIGIIEHNLVLILIGPELFQLDMWLNSKVAYRTNIRKQHETYTDVILQCNVLYCYI